MAYTYSSSSSSSNSDTEKFEKAEKERDDLKLALEKFEGSSKNLSRLLDSQQVPPPYTGNYMPPKPDLVFADEHVVSESITSLPDIAKTKVKTSEIKLKNASAPIIEDWVSDSEDENEIDTESKHIKPSSTQVKFVTSTVHVKFSRKSVKQEESNKQTKYHRKTNQSLRGQKQWLVMFKEIEKMLLSPQHAGFGEQQEMLFIISPNTVDHTCLKDLTMLIFKDVTSGILKTFITRMENQINHRVKTIKCDNETEFKNSAMNQFYHMKGIKREFSVAMTPQQNGVAERKNKTLIEASRTMLADSLLPTTFWAKAVNIACYVQNRVLVRKSHNKTLYELLIGRSPNIEFMKPFGCPVTILNTLDHLEC
nr:putative ribonuclease H-like domain-containing protein [Tanacetum cinerariifolium]